MSSSGLPLPEGFIAVRSERTISDDPELEILSEKIVVTVRDFSNSQGVTETLSARFFDRCQKA